MASRIKPYENGHLRKFYVFPKVPEGLGVG